MIYKMLNSLFKEMIPYYSNTTNIRLHAAPVSSLGLVTIFPGRNIREFVTVG